MLKPYANILVLLLALLSFVSSASFAAEPAKLSSFLPKEDGALVRHFESIAKASNTARTPFEYELLEKVLLSSSTNPGCGTTQDLRYVPTVECLEGRNDRSGKVSIGRHEYEYYATGGVIEWIRSDGKRTGTFDAYAFLTEAFAGDKAYAKCLPLCAIVPGVIILGQGVCLLSENVGTNSCRSACPCGFARVERTCVLGYLSVKCECRECPQPPLPVPTPVPSGPGGSGPYWPGTPWDFSQGAPWVVDDGMGWMTR